MNRGLLQLFILVLICSMTVWTSACSKSDDEGFEKTTDGGYRYSFVSERYSYEILIHATGNHLIVEKYIDHGNNKDNEYEKWSLIDDPESTTCYEVAYYLLTVADAAFATSGDMEYRYYVGGELVRGSEMTLAEAYWEYDMRVD